EAPAHILKYIVEKGSVTLDGASLTVNRVSAGTFEIMVIPHTQAMLAAEFLAVGHVVNIEVDILGKYVEKLLACQGAKQSDIEPQPSSLTFERLREAGFC
ncbi:MAG: riboflavin synthase, partial [Proteobacteria bacterium]|nr:riboflavin synthase [Pseudomonadota bacterium]